MFKTVILSYLITIVFASPVKCVTNVQNVTNVPNLQGEDLSRYWTGSNCNVGGIYSVNEFKANICEYPGETCPVVKYFSYANGGGGVELCCNTNSDCNYAAIKNYCHPDLKRCTDGSYWNCSEKGGPIFDSCK